MSVFPCVLLSAAVLSGATLPLPARTPGGGPRAPAAQDLGPILQKHLDRFREQAGFPGGALAASRGRDDVVVVTTGMRDRRTEEPVQADDRFLAGSIGKTFVGAVALKLAEQETLGLDDFIADWFADDEWFERLPNGDEITVRMLMHHTSGLPDHLRNEGFLRDFRASPEKEWQPEELISYAFDMEAQFPAGEQWAYADFNYIVLGAVVERAGEATVEELVQSLFLDPLELEGILPQGLVVPRIVTGHCRAGRVLGYPEYVVEDGRFVLNPQMEWCGGGYATTPGDLARWTCLLYSGALHSDDIVAQQRDGVRARTGRNQQYGLAVQIRDCDHGRVYYHGGWFPGYMSETAYYADQDLALTVQVNSDYQTSPSRFQGLLDGVVGECQADE